MRLEALHFHGADLGQRLDHELRHLQVGDQRHVVVNGTTTDLRGHSLLARVWVFAKGCFPWKVDAHVNLGNAFINLGKLDEAVDSYEKALAINPNHNARFNLGRALLRVRGKYQEGLKQMRKSRGVIEFVSGKEKSYSILH